MGLTGSTRTPPYVSPLSPPPASYPLPSTQLNSTPRAAHIMRGIDCVDRVQGQYVDGLRSGVVIHPESEVHAYDEEYTIILGDWYHDQHSELIDEFINIANPGGAEPVPGAPASLALHLPPLLLFSLFFSSLLFPHSLTFLTDVMGANPFLLVVLRDRDRDHDRAQTPP